MVIRLVLLDLLFLLALQIGLDCVEKRIRRPQLLDFLGLGLALFFAQLGVLLRLLEVLEVFSESGQLFEEAAADS